MVVSALVVGLICLAVGASITVSLRAAQSARDPAGAYNQTVTARSALDLVSDDMKAATRIEPLYIPPWPSGTLGMTLTVPARNADTSPETIVYSWGGAGQSFLRKYNSNAAVSIADNVQSFNVTYSPEQLFVIHDGGSGSNVTSYTISNGATASEYFRPTLPGSATAWSITHIKVQMLKSGTGGAVTFSLYPASAALTPTGTVIASGSANTSGASSAQWLDVPLSATGLTPGTGYCLVLTGSGGKALNDTTGLTVNTSYANSTTGTTWNTVSNASLQFAVYGSTTP